ncbi:RRM 1 and PWI domain containing protein [Trichuris trichiura]|uniref:RRM 1 and PWI domain containing protein n=1 Tax=Trichuris trichiura TaxID=36087 RepID=A0A077ZEX2_TRITR|nr:RRM 1 and PWI domain containing protein [Trichuris trichiura]
MTTVFVGNIHERVSNDLIKAMLMKCGNIMNWKRIQGPSGKYQAFGFCEYDHPDSTLRALRLLHDWPLGDKKLVLKCDEKNKKTLIEFINKRRELYGKPPLVLEGDQLPADDEMKKEDEQFRKALQQLVVEMAGDLCNSSGTNDVDRKSASPSVEDQTTSSKRPRERSRSHHSARSGSSESRQSAKKSRRRDESRDSSLDRRDCIFFKKRLSEADEDDAYERRRVERRIREKEAAFRERLAKWENREQRKAAERQEKAAKLAQLAAVEVFLYGTVNFSLASSSGNQPMGFAGLKLGAATTVAAANATTVKPNFFAEDETQEEPPARKLVPLEYTEEESGVQLTAEEKRRVAKVIIEKIPTSKDELFAQDILWDYVDSVGNRIRPWVGKKIVEYIGEEEVSLVDFICQKVKQKAKPQEILDDISMVLDEEATVFVVKLWRLLIYEIEAKRQGVTTKPDGQA